MNSNLGLCGGVFFFFSHDWKTHDFLLLLLFILQMLALVFLAILILEQWDFPPSPYLLNIPSHCYTCTISFEYAKLVEFFTAKNTALFFTLLKQFK